MKIDVLALAKESWTEFNADKSPRLAAAIAYAAVFAIAPLFIIVIAIAGWYFGLANAGQVTVITSSRKKSSRRLPYRWAATPAKRSTA